MAQLYVGEIRHKYNYKTTADAARPASDKQPSVFQAPEVETEFRKNFTERGKLGAACAIYHKGKKAVDLWGGYRDEKKTLTPWEEDTLTLVFSMTKGMAAIAVAVAHSHGLLNYDEKVSTYQFIGR